MDDAQRLLSNVAEVRARLGGISRSRFDTWAAETGFPLGKLGRVTRVREADVAGYLASLSLRRGRCVDRKPRQAR